mmetsp:Transcript_23396/g.47570  ORF Transcript_23396/g.47570 Transcript_23396/m.47570 type:complete len:130 (-) Transcript_23396:376-765(-)
MKMKHQHPLLTMFLALLALLSSALAFAPTSSSSTPFASPSRFASYSSPLKAAPDTIAFDAFSQFATESTSYPANLVSVATLDPTTFLSDALGGLLGSYAILAVPIVAAFSVVAVIAFLIVSYANPADED